MFQFCSILVYLLWISLTYFTWCNCCVLCYLILFNVFANSLTFFLFIFCLFFTYFWYRLQHQRRSVKSWIYCHIYQFFSVNTTRVRRHVFSINLLFINFKKLSNWSWSSLLHLFWLNNSWMRLSHLQLWFITRNFWTLAKLN